MSKERLQKKREWNVCSLMRHLCSATASTATASSPVFPGVLATLENLCCTVEVGRGVARSVATVAATPVDAVDLPETDIIRIIRVVVASVCIASRFCVGNALTALLRPAAVLRAPVRDTDLLRATTNVTATVGVVDTGGCSCSKSSEDNR